MAVALRIARLTTRLQLPSDAHTEGGEAMGLQEFSQRTLPAALDGVAERALSRAGLPLDAVVAVRRLTLRLRLVEDASDNALLRAWSQTLETALATTLLQAVAAGAGGADPGSGSAPGDGAAAANAVVFADAWEAEFSHLSRIAQGLEPAWWVDRLRDGRGEPLDLSPPAVLWRWLELQPGRAVAAMAALVDRADAAATPAALLSLLPEASAVRLASGLAGACSQRPTAQAEVPEGGTPLRGLLEETLERLRRHRVLAGCNGDAALPWRLAVLLHQQPSLSLLPARTLLEVAAGPGGQANASTAQAVEADSLERSDPEGDPGAAPLPARLGNASEGDPAAEDPAAEVPPAEDPAAGRVRVHAAGLLLLLRRPEWHDEPEDWGTVVGDVALLALLRLLEPLGPGERAAALEKERPLLTLLTPDRSWPERLVDARMRQPQAAAERLDALIATIPEGVDFAPGALRQVYGPIHGTTPPLPDRASHTLARLLWRPGELVWDRWQIALHWPHASADGALRRAGWDLDPGWHPALRRVVRFVYGGEP